MESAGPKVVVYGDGTPDSAPVLLDDTEVRVLGALLEKQVTTPDYYPLTLNALVNACNQTSSRDPVVSYDEATVTRALDGLREQKLASVSSGAESRVAKYRHKTTERFQLSSAEVASLCLLLLRGPQTVGEIRTRSGRLHEFETVAEVEQTLEALSTKQPQPLVIRLPRQPGFKESRYAHLLAGPPKIAGVPTENIATSPAPAGAVQASLADEVAELRREVGDLRRQFAEFKKQFE